MKKSLEKELDKIVDKLIYAEINHLGCPSYPNCEEAPLGCAVLQGKNVEWYGHRDKTKNSIDYKKKN
jgi:hypothetical protein